MRRLLDTGRYAPYMIAGKVFVKSTVELTRPADTTVYTALDAISDSTSAPTILTFADVTPNDGTGGIIRRASVHTDQAANTSQFRLHLYKATIAAVNDNAAMTRPYAAKEEYLGVLSFAAAVLGRAELAVEIPFDLPYDAAATTNDLFGQLESIDGFTPASAQKFWIELVIEQG